jgi:hypothetical protein
VLCTSLTFFGLGEWTSHVQLMAEHFSNHCQSLCRTFSEICTKFDAVPLSDPSRNIMRPDTWLQRKGRKKSAPPLSCVNVCTLTPTINLVLSPTVASRYYNCCTAGSTSPGNYGYSL